MARQSTTSRMQGQVYIANESFVADPLKNGIDKAYHQGRTRVYAGDPILEQAPHLFDLLEDHMGDDQV